MMFRNCFLLSAFLCNIVFVTPAMAIARSLPYSVYNRSVIVELRRLEESDRQQQSDILEAHESLIQAPIGSADILPSERDHVFRASTPRMQWIGDESRISCDAVRYANRSAQYLFRRFKVLRLEALQLLDAMDRLSGRRFDEAVRKYDAVIAEITELLDLVEGAFPPSFYEYDRLAIYQFEQSNHFKRTLALPNQVPAERMTVTKIKFGDDNWLPVPSGIKGMLNFVDEPEISRFDYDIRVTRKLNPLEACLGDLNVSVIGSVEFRQEPRPIIVSPIIICPRAARDA